MPIPKVTAICWLEDVIESLWSRAESGDIRYIDTEINTLEDVLDYIKKSKPYRKAKKG